MGRADGSPAELPVTFTEKPTMTTYLEADSKFWEITVDGCDFSVRFGKLGAAGATSDKSWPSEDKCEKEAEKLIRAKKKKGYAEAAGTKKSTKKAPAKAKAKAKAPAKKGGKCFSKCVFCISGSLSKTKSEMTTLITDNGGTVSAGVTKATTHLLTSDADYQAGTGKVSKARSNGTPIVHEDFIFDSIKQGSLADAGDYDMGDMHGDKEEEESESEEEEEPPKKKKKSSGGTNKTYLEADSKFWEINVTGSSFTVRFGKLGAAGATSTKDWADAEKCLKEANKLINQKKKKGYSE